ncbi:3-ketoacyl-CoA thiolase, peroxisomal [Astathelohania contejeani]|uniref:acetyl-CoA C-acyltransferase n=1 Tax=Astathelohania contejeani TaxID=164912 RepID=A0ABQ7I285_9MICR|nr:3-ketoacyl-CoA thiolase, peroxisomal [Thelohania contejeani]
MTSISKNEEDVVIVAAYRTPFGKASKGSFKNITVDYLLYTAISGSLNRANISPELIEEVVLGNVLCNSGGTIESRMACLRSGIPVSTPVMTINRQCGSGLEAVYNIVQKIREGSIEVGMAGGFESMTKNMMPNSYDTCTEVQKDENAKDCLLSMGMVSENMAEIFNILRNVADIYATKSQNRAVLSKNKFQNEIIPVKIDGIEVFEDDGIRNTSVDSLAKLRPAFKENGVSTAGNSSQLSDGAAIVILMKRKTAIKLGCSISGVFIDYCAVGVEPGIMGIGPVKAIPKLLKRNNLEVDDISVFEINEAFAVQAICCIEELHLDTDKVNKYGGSIALGHPLGASGARLIGTILNIMNSGDLGVVSLCVGTGMGVAALIRKE